MNSLNAFAEIDLKALSHNLGIAREKTKNNPVLAVVKANAYGHGSVEISKHMLKNGAAMLGVAFTEEAIELREAGITAPIVVFFDNSEIDAYFRHSLTPVIFNLKNAESFSTRAREHNRRIAAHIKVDTGMGRVGLNLSDSLSEIPKIAGLKNLELEGIMSHFSDADMKDKDFSSIQLKSFTGLVESLKKKNIHFKFCHIANSAAVLGFPEAHLNMVRPGIMLYGYGPSDLSDKPDLSAEAESGILKPVLSLRSKIVFLKNVPAGTPISYGRTFITKRKSAIATIPIGYADGYSRKLSNCGEVLINGKRAPVVGRVCMDTTMIDVTDIPEARENTDVTIIGQDRGEKITAQDIADKVGSIPYEILTCIGKRVKRIYTPAAK